MRILTAALLVLAATLAAAQPATIPMEVVGGRVHLPVSVNGNPPAMFILDTGAGASALDAEYAKSIGIEVSGSGQSIGAGGRVAVSLANNVALRIGGIDHRLPRTALIPLGPISLRSGRPVAGVLGHDVLERFVTEFDYANRTLTLYPPRDYQPPKGAVALPVEFQRNLPVIRVPVTLEDGRAFEMKLVVDSGASPPLVLKKHFVDQNKIDTSRALATPTGLGVGGATTGRAGRVARIQLGSVVLQKPVTMFSESEDGELANRSNDGLLGADALRRFRFITDYPHKRLWFVPAASVDEAFELDASGLQLTARDATFSAIDVFDVRPDSPAVDAGVSAGDELLAIDGRAVTPAQLPEIRELLRQPDKTYKLTIARKGEQKEVTLKTRRMV